MSQLTNLSHVPFPKFQVVGSSYTSYAACCAALANSTSTTTTPSGFSAALNMCVKFEALECLLSATTLYCQNNAVSCQLPNSTEVSTASTYSSCCSSYSLSRTDTYNSIAYCHEAEYNYCEPSGAEPYCIEFPNYCLNATDVISDNFIE